MSSPNRAVMTICSDMFKETLKKGIKRCLVHSKTFNLKDSEKEENKLFRHTYNNISVDLCTSIIWFGRGRN